MNGCPATDRCLFRITGKDATTFLQGLLTNDMQNLKDTEAVYAALLTPQGKFLTDCFVFVQKISDSDTSKEHTLFLDLPCFNAAKIIQRLTMYKLRSDVNITAMPNMIFYYWGKTLPPMDEAKQTAFLDPRNPNLGWRIYAAERPKNIDLTDEFSSEYDRLRITLGVPKAGAELIENESYILEYGFDRLNGVSFRKGCYVGQEIVARMKHKTTLRKGLALVSIAPASSEALENKPPKENPNIERVQGDFSLPQAVHNESGQMVGRLTSVDQAIGLAHLRFDRTDQPLSTESGHHIEIKQRLVDAATPLK